MLSLKVIWDKMRPEIFKPIGHANCTIYDAADAKKTAVFCITFTFLEGSKGGRKLKIDQKYPEYKLHLEHSFYHKICIPWQGGLIDLPEKFRSDNRNPPPEMSSGNIRYVNFRHK